MEKLDIEILKNVKSLQNLSKKKRSYFHIKSIINIASSLINDKPKNKYLKKISVIRKKELLLYYLLIIRKNDTTKSSRYYYNNYVSKLGQFMNSYYKFSLCGGRIIILTIILYFFIGFFIDFLSYILFDRAFMFTLLFSLLGVSRVIIKNYQKKVYGPYW